MEDGKFYLTFTGPILDAPIAQLIQLLENTVKQEQIKHLYLALNTPGGSVNAGITFYHYLRSLPIEVSTHNIGQVDSIGSVIFLAGTDRKAASATSFLLHGVTFGPPPNMQFTKGQLKEIQSQIAQDEVRISAITLDRTKLKQAQLSRFFRTGRSLSPSDARKYGIVTSIGEFEIPDGAKKGVVNTFPIPNQGNIPNGANGQFVF